MSLLGRAIARTLHVGNSIYWHSPLLRLRSNRPRTESLVPAAEYVRAGIRGHPGGRRDCFLWGLWLCMNLKPGQPLATAKLRT